MTEPKDIAERHTGEGAWSRADKIPTPPELSQEIQTGAFGDDPQLEHARRVAEGAYRDALSYQPPSPARAQFPDLLRAVYDDAYNVGVSERGRRGSPVHPHDLRADGQRRLLEGQ